MILRLIGFLIIMAGSGVNSVPPGAHPAIYQFKNETSPIYEYTIRAELPNTVDTQSGHIFYAIKSVDPVNGQITLGCSSEFHIDRQRKGADGQVDAAPHSRPQMANAPWPDPAAGPDIVIDSSGRQVRTVRGIADQLLPELLGLAWQLPLQPLPQEGKLTWDAADAITLYERAPQSRAPISPFARQQPVELIERPAHAGDCLYGRFTDRRFDHHQAANQPGDRREGRRCSRGKTRRRRPVCVR